MTETNPFRETSPFRPDWCLAPDGCLLEWMSEHDVTPGHLARLCGRGKADIKARLLIADVLNRRPLLAAHAEALERGTGIKAAFWLRLEENYRDGLAGGLTDASGPLSPLAS